MRSVVPWSWSSLDAYDLCPRRFHEVKILKNYVEEESAQMLWGNDVHKALELGVVEGKPLPENMVSFTPYIDQILKAPGDKYAEVKLAVNKDLEYTGFLADDCWARGVGDIVIINGNKGFAGDYKTGKKKPKSRQLDLMACLAFAAFPQLEVINTAFMWLQFKSTTNKVVQRTDTEQIWDGFRQNVSEMEWSERNNAWPAKPSGLCRAWCPVTGCAHNGKRR